MPERSAPPFRRSSFCYSGDCVEVAKLPDGRVAVRDSKHPELGPRLFDAAEWQAFIAGVKAGEFDLAALDA